ncbi:MAG: hypothetical protein WAZ94_07455 [Phycisphaerales bacterium]
MSGFKQTWQRLPRAGRWLGVFLVFLGLYFFIVEPGVDLFLRYAALGDVHRATLAKYAEAKDEVRRADDVVKLGMAHFGAVEFPGDYNQRTRELNTAIDGILATNGVEGYTGTTRTVAMGQGLVTKRLPEDSRVERLTRTIDFTAHPGAVAGVLADLEQTPVVSTISSVQLRQVEGRDGESGRLLNAVITIETWVTAKKGTTR